MDRGKGGCQQAATHKVNKSTRAVGVAELAGGIDSKYFSNAHFSWGDVRTPLGLARGRDSLNAIARKNG